MSYDNAEPKILKTLNSNGQVLDSSGEVIADTSDYWVKTYNQAEPKPDKILNSDGTITDSAGNLIQDTTPFNVKKYNQAEPIPAKYLHADGIIDENPGSGGGADLDNNVAETIDVSTYTEPVVINPTSGKDGMKKATVTLDNIPSGGSATAYAWVNDGGHVFYFDFDIAPSDLAEYNTTKSLIINEDGHCEVFQHNFPQSFTYEKNSDTEFYISNDDPKPAEETYTRDSTRDFTLWQVNE